jgi:hypothetical protein
MVAMKDKRDRKREHIVSACSKYRQLAVYGTVIAVSLPMALLLWRYVKQCRISTIAIN